MRVVIKRQSKKCAPSLDFFRREKSVVKAKEKFLKKDKGNIEQRGRHVKTEKEEHEREDVEEMGVLWN